LLGFRYMASTVLDLPDIVLLIGSVLLGATIYIVSLRLIASDALTEMVGLGQEVVRPFTGPMIAKMHRAEKKPPYVGPDVGDQM